MMNNLDQSLAQRLANERRRTGDQEPVNFRSAVRVDEAGQFFRGNAIEMEPVLAREFAEWITRQLKFDRPVGHEDREVYVTPIPGHYGLAGYAVTVNGSPHRGMMLVNLGTSCGPSVALTLDGCKFIVGRAHGSVACTRRYVDGMSFIKRMGLSCSSNADPRNPLAINQE